MMNTECPGSTQGAKPTKRPEKRLRKRSAKRRPKQRNALYCLAAEFKHRHPGATAAEAWLHFVAVAATGCHDVVLRHDAARDALEYLPDPDRRGIRTVVRKTFFNQFFRLCPV